ncbi:tRNA lysidine(34) synthetase TilS [Leucobacter sp. GX24907]
MPRLDAAVADARTAVRRTLAEWSAERTNPGERPAPLVLVALSGGSDSLALAAALAFEAERAGCRAGAAIIDHGLQSGSEQIAARAAAVAGQLGLAPVVVRRIAVPGGSVGPEAAARMARYAALETIRADIGAELLLTAHTRDDQAEQVLLALARGSGTRSISGIPVERGAIRRPFLRATPEIDRATTERACSAQGLEPWHDPQNLDPAFTRVRVRHRILPMLEAELGPGVARALARTADLTREDAEALDEMVDEMIEELVEPAEAGIAASVGALAANPAALRNRIIRRIAADEFGETLSREHTLAIAELVTAWRGQGPINVPGISVSRRGGLLVFSRQRGSPRVQ